MPEKRLQKTRDLYWEDDFRYFIADLQKAFEAADDAVKRAHESTILITPPPKRVQ